MRRNQTGKRTQTSSPLRGGWRSLVLFCEAWKMKQYMMLVMILMSAMAAFGQPVWEDVNPLPGHDICFVTELITEESGMWAVVCTDSGHCYSQNYRPYYSADGGNTWELRDNGINGFGDLGVLMIDINPANPDLLLATSQGPQVLPYISYDRGLHWESLETIPDSIPYGSWAYYAGWFPDGAHAYAYSRSEFNDHRCFLSEDTCQSWEQLEVFETHLHPFFMDPRMPSLIMNSGLGITISFDYFRTRDWTIHDPMFDIRFGGYGEQFGRIYGTCHYFEYYPGPRYRVPCVSSDTGRTWQFLNPADTARWNVPGPPAPRVLKDNSTPGHLFFMRVDSLFETLDDGNSWELLWGGPGGEYRFTLICYQEDQDQIYVMASREIASTRYPALWRLDRGSAAIEIANKPASFMLYQNYPNPFNLETTICYSLFHEQSAEVAVYDILGKEVIRIERKRQSAGYHEIGIMPNGWSSGIYILRLKSDASAQSVKMVYLK